MLCDDGLVNKNRLGNSSWLTFRYSKYSLQQCNNDCQQLPRIYCVNGAARLTPTPRPYQANLKLETQRAWHAGFRNVLLRSATGSGKTVILGSIVEDETTPVCLLAHRAELVGQLSLCLARFGIRHDLICANDTKRAIAALHIAETGACWFTPGARVVVASVDTIIRRRDIAAWAATVQLVGVDEGAHLVGVCEATGNKWWKALNLFTHPLRRVITVTATPIRSDGKGLGAHADGVIHKMVEGPSERWLIDQGYLADYRIVCVESDLKALIETEDVGASGDWSQATQRTAAGKSHIVSDVVKEYQRHAAGMLACTFCVSVETAVDTTAAFREAGIPAETLTGKTDDHLRRQILRRFANREILQLCSVDIIAEGFDLPAIEVVQMARPTQSVGLYRQQVGRAMRPKPDGSKALIIDHVGNVMRHGLPDRPIAWSLDRRDKRSSGKSDAIPLRVCLGCFQPYERIHAECPHCGTPIPEPSSRSAPEHVDGDLAELSPEVLAQLRGAVAAADRTPDEVRAHYAATGLPDLMVRAQVNRHHERTQAQAALRHVMAQWAGPFHAAGECDRTLQRRFFMTYGVDVLSAKAFGRTEAITLTKRILPNESLDDIVTAA